MAHSISQPTFSAVAATTFAKSDLYKFLQFTTDAQVQVVATTAPTNLAGTLLSVTGTTAGDGVEAVTVGRLEGVGMVYMAGSTRDAGQTISASSLGFGIAPTTNSLQLGIIVEGSSGSTGRILPVSFGSKYDA